MKLGSTLIIAFVIAWMMQFALTYLQMRRFNKRLIELRKSGTTVTGMSGSMYKRRAYGILVIDKNEKILKAEQFSGWTVFAGLKPVKELEGISIKDVIDESIELPVSKKIRSAFQNAVAEFEKARQKAAKGKNEFGNGTFSQNSSGRLTG